MLYMEDVILIQRTMRMLERRAHALHEIGEVEKATNYLRVSQQLTYILMEYEKEKERERTA